MGFREIRRLGEGTAGRGRGALRVAGGTLGAGEIGQSLWKHAAGANRLRYHFDGARRLAAILRDHPQQVESVGLFGRLRQNLAIQKFGFVHATRPMMGKAGMEVAQQRR